MYLFDLIIILSQNKCDSGYFYHAFLSNKYNMTQKTTPIQAYQKINQKMIKKQDLIAVPLSVSMVHIHSLEQHPQYAFIIDKLKSYSNKVTQNPKIDEYEIRTYEKLFHLLRDLISIDNKEIQISQIKQTKLWLQEQQKIIKNRVHTSLQQFMINKDIRSAVVLVQKLFQKQDKLTERVPTIPSEIIDQVRMPYYRKWRTAHQDISLPDKRLIHYQTKKIQIQPPSINQLSKTVPTNYKILNNSISYGLNTRPHQSIFYKDQDIKQVQTQIQLQQPSIANQNDLPQQIVLPDDIPMFGEEPQEGDQQKDAQANDDLVPKIKLYQSETKISEKQKLQQTSFIHFKTKQSIQQKRLQLKFKNNRAKEIIQNKQDKQMIQMSERMAKDKSTLIKELNKKLQLSTLNPSYNFLQKQVSKQQFKLSQDLQSKYYLSETRPVRKQNKIDLEFHLPKLSNSKPKANLQRTIEKPSLRVLKKRFSHILNLSSEQQHEDVKQTHPRSMAQFTGRTRAFSQVLQKCSSKSYRQEGIEQLQSVRERLNSKKLKINLKALVGGLCAPEDNSSNLQMLPQKNLLHNQFMAESKKSKKKKK